MYERLVELITAVAAELNDTLDEKLPLERGADTPLYGRSGVLDSLQLVTLVVAIEQAIEERIGTAVTLADERALSQTRSPFRTIGSLAEYATRLLSETAGDP